VIAAENIDANEMIIEYIGEIIGKALADQRERVLLIYNRHSTLRCMIAAGLVATCLESMMKKSSTLLLEAI
jgi:hypothetical protein